MRTAEPLIVPNRNGLLGLLAPERGEIFYGDMKQGFRFRDALKHGFGPVPGNSRLSFEQAHDIINDNDPAAMPNMAAILMEHVPGLHTSMMWDPEVFDKVCPDGLAFVVTNYWPLRLVTVVSREEQGYVLLVRRF